MLQRVKNFDERYCNIDLHVALSQKRFSQRFQENQALYDTKPLWEAIQGSVKKYKKRKNYCRKLYKKEGNKFF